MRVAFVWPAAFDQRDTLPLAYGLLAPAIRHAGHVPLLLNLPLEGLGADDPRALERVERMRPDVVGLSVWPFAAEDAFVTARAVRRRMPRVPLIAGGALATVDPVRCLSDAPFDLVLSGEAERTLPLALAALETRAFDGIPGLTWRRADGSIGQTPRRFERQLDELAPMDFGFIQLDRAIRKGYMRTALGPARKAPIIATRGCSHACSFCAVPQIQGRQIRSFAAAAVAAQVLHLYEGHGIRDILFMDDNATQRRAQWKDVCRAIADLRLPDLLCETYRGVRLETLDSEMLALMRLAGFREVCIAPESGSERVRRALMGKTIGDASIREAVARIRRAGLGLHGFFIVGYPGETAAERQATWRMVEELDFDAAKIHKYAAIPGTDTFTGLVADGRLDPSYLPQQKLLGVEAPSFVSEGSDQIDKEIALFYARFFLRRPRRVHDLLRMTSPGAIWSTGFGLLRGAARAARKDGLAVGRGGRGREAARAQGTQPFFFASTQQS